MRKLLGDPRLIRDDQRVKGFKKVFGYYDKGIYNMMTNKFRKLFEVMDNFIIDNDIKNMISESTTSGSPTDDNPPTFYRGFDEYTRFSKKWIDDMYKNDGWEVVHHILKYLWDKS